MSWQGDILKFYPEKKVREKKSIPRMVFACISDRYLGLKLADYENRSALHRPTLVYRGETVHCSASDFNITSFFAAF